MGENSGHLDRTCHRLLTFSDLSENGMFSPAEMCTTERNASFIAAELAWHFRYRYL